MTLVKICGITTLEDALQAIEAGADALGFNFYPKSPRYLEPGAARAIIEKLPAVVKAGVFVDEGSADIEAVARFAGLDVAQIHGEADYPPGIRWWQAWPATLAGLRERMNESGAEAFLLDTPAGEQRGGTGRTFDWSLACGLPGKVILAGGLGPGNVAAAVKQVRPWGVDACSRLEIRPGRKDHGKVAEFIRAVRETESE